MYYGETKTECTNTKMTDITSTTFTLKSHKTNSNGEEEEDELTIFFDTPLKSPQQAIPLFYKMANEAFDKLKMVTYP